MQGSSGGRSNGRGVEEEDESQARGGFAAARMTPPSKPPRLPSGSSLRQGQSPQKRIGDGNTVAGDEGGPLEKENSKRVRLEAPSSKAAKPSVQQNQTGGTAKPPSGGEGGDFVRGGPRLRAEGLMAPPAADAATLRRQVAALQVELEAHIEGEGKLQSLNTQLRERSAKKICFPLLVRLKMTLTAYVVAESPHFVIQTRPISILTTFSNAF